MSDFRRLGTLAEVTLGRQRSPEHESGPHMAPYLRAANVKDGQLDLNDVKEMNFTPVERVRFGLQPGDVLVTEGAGSLAAVGASAVWSGDLAGTVCFQNTLLRLRPRPGVDGRYLAWWARHAYADGRFAAEAAGANIFHLSAERARSIPVVTPRLPAQRAIADFLDTETARVDRVVQSKRDQLALLVERRIATTELSVVGSDAENRRPSTLAWAGSIPTHWRAVKLGFVARLGSGHTPSRDQPEWWLDCTIPWITTGEVAQMRSDRIEEVVETREKISELGIANSSATVHPKGTVVLCRTASAGYSAIMGQDMATSQDFATWTCGPLLRPRYLLLCLRAMRRDLLGRLAMGSTHKTIYMPDIESIRIPLPPVDEQDRIVDRTWARLRAIDRAADAIEQHMDLLNERKQALITAAVTGELDLARELAGEAS